MKSIDLDDIFSITPGRETPGFPGFLNNSQQTFLGESYPLYWELLERTFFIKIIKKGYALSYESSPLGMNTRNKS